MNSKKVSLTDGREVTVYAPPVIRIFNILNKQHPEPEAPVVTEKTVTGDEISMVIENDPAFLEAHAEWERITDEKSQEMNVLFALRDEQVPEDFDIEEQGDELRFLDPDWEPRTGKMGRKLDWIEWELLANPADAGRVQSAINDLISIDLEVVEQVEDSFRDSVEEEAT